MPKNRRKLKYPPIKRVVPKFPFKIKKKKVLRKDTKEAFVNDSGEDTWGLWG